MKRMVFLLAILLSVSGLSAQENFSDLVKVGDELIIAKAPATTFNYIDIPRKNFIIKRGGIANISSLENTIVTITKMTTEDNPKITFKRSDGNKFFKAYRTLTADLNKAINNGELKFRDSTKKDSLAK